MTGALAFPVDSIQVEVDNLFRAQGADPASVRARRPALISLAEQAITTGMGLIKPRTWLTVLPVEAVRHNHLRLAGGFTLRGDLVLQELSSAEQVAVGLVTVGPELDNYIQEYIHQEAPLAYLVDAFGSAAVDQVQCCLQDQVVQQACDQGLSTTTPLSPGLIGWPVDTGQEDIFRILSPDPTVIRLTESYQMVPRKSASFVMGIGRDLKSGVPCDYCSARERCHHRKQK